MSVRTKVLGPAVVLGVVTLAATVAGSILPTTEHRKGNARIIRAEVEVTHGEFDVSLLVVSNLDGERDLQSGEMFTRSFGEDITLREGEVLNVHLTAVAHPDDLGRRKLTCRLRDNGKQVMAPAANSSRIIRSGEVGDPASCTHVFRN